jgi:predicted acetyltransferase
LSNNTDELKLILPSLDRAVQILDYKAKSLENGSHLHGAGGLDAYDSISDWLDFLEEKSQPETCPEGLVPDSTYLCLRMHDDCLIGMVNIRHRLNDYLLNFGGHVGYSVHPAHRGQGYGKQQLRLALDKCRVLGLSRVLLTCNESNEASRSVIRANGGVLEDVRTNPDGERMQRWWITL